MLHSLVVIDRTRDVGLIVYTYNEMTKNISGQFVEHWSEKERWCLGNLILGSKLPLDVIEICDRSKTISKTGTTKTKDIYVDISDTRRRQCFLAGESGICSSRTLYALSRTC